MIKRATPIQLYLNGPVASIGAPGFYYNGTNYGYGIGFGLNGCANTVMNFSSATTNPAFSFPDMATYAGIYDEFRVKSFSLDCMVSTNAVAPTGGTDASQLTAAPIIQFVCDPNESVAPASVTSLLSYNTVEVWHASTGNSRRTVTIRPNSAPLNGTGLSAVGLEVGNSWVAASQYSSSLMGFIKMYYDYEAAILGGVQGVLTIYPIIEVEWRTQF